MAYATQRKPEASAAAPPPAVASAPEAGVGAYRTEGQGYASQRDALRPGPSALQRKEAPLHANSMVKGSDADGKPMEVQKGKRFIRGPGDALDIDPNDAVQGALGDCYLLAALAAVAKTDPGLIRNMVKKADGNKFTVTFQFPGTFMNREEVVTVDAGVPVWTKGGNPVFAKVGDRSGTDKELWVLLVEKAWAQVKGSYLNIEGHKITEDVLALITGKETQAVDPSTVGSTMLLVKLFLAHEGGHPVVVYSVDDKHSKARLAGADGVVTNHGYALMGVDLKAKTVDLYNPHGGNTSLNGFAIDKVRKYFRTVRINGA